MSVLCGGTFAGWAGLQPCGGDEFEIAIVLLPENWGLGLTVFEDLVHMARLNGLTALIARVPQSRTRVRGLSVLGFRFLGLEEIHGEQFHRYRLDLI